MSVEAHISIIDSSGGDHCHNNRNIYCDDPNQVCLGVITSHCSLRANGLTATGAIALAEALQHNKSLEELK